MTSLSVAELQEIWSTECPGYIKNSTIETWKNLSDGDTTISNKVINYDNNNKEDITMKLKPEKYVEKKGNFYINRIRYGT